MASATSERDRQFDELWQRSMSTLGIRIEFIQYDTLYRKSRTLPDGAERNTLYRKMSELVAAYNPWELGIYTIDNTLAPRVRGYKKNIYHEHAWKYCDVDSALSGQRSKR